MSQQNEITKQSNELIATLVESLPPAYLEAHAAANALNQAFHTALGKAIEQRLNPFLANQPQKTLEEKKELAMHVNADLRVLGLAVRCPRTGAAAVLIADAGDMDDASSRFRIESREERRKIRSTVSLKDPNLEICPDTPFTSRHRRDKEEGWDR